jgi:hypothetical protein
MTEQDKPFVCYKSRWNFTIAPRKAAGWWALVWWLLALAPPTAGYAWLMAREPSDAAVVAWTTGYILLAVVWALTMTRWMYLRSEVIDMADVLEWKRRRDRSKRRGP